jgi:hypothetical protein
MPYSNEKIAHSGMLSQTIVLLLLLFIVLLIIGVKP